MEWIKTSDKLPDLKTEKRNTKHYLVTVNAPDRTTLQMNYCRRTIKNHEVFRWEWNGRLSPWEVIAWSEMPEPYVKEA